MGRIIAIAAPILILLLLGIGGTSLLGALKPEPEQAEPVDGGLNVFGERVKKGDLKLDVVTQGEVRPQREVNASPQISGRIAYVNPNFIDGGFVRKGQVLVRLEADDYELAIVRANSTVAAAEQRLLREQAEAELALEDIRELGIENVSPLARREPQLAEARANLDASKSQLEDARLALKRTEVYAPFSGRVRSRNVEIGQFVSPGQSLGNIFANDVVEVSLPLNDQEMGRLGLPLAFAASRNNPGPKVTFTANAGGIPRTWVGQVVRTGAAINSQTRQINVIAELKDPYGAGADDGAPMAPGLFVDARIEGQVIEDVFIAPRGALRGENKLFIGLPDEGLLSIRDVDVIHSDPTGAYVLEGVEEGDLGIISPIQGAFDGMKVTVMERMEDGTIEVYEPDRVKNATDDDALTAETSSASEAKEAN